MTNALHEVKKKWKGVRDSRSTYQCSSSVWVEKDGGYVHIPAIKMHVEYLVRSVGQPYGPSMNAGTLQKPFAFACALKRPVKPSRPRIRKTTSFSPSSVLPSRRCGMLAIVNGCASVGRSLTVGRMT